VAGCAANPDMLVSNETFMDDFSFAHPHIKLSPPRGTKALRRLACSCKLRLDPIRGSSILSADMLEMAVLHVCCNNGSAGVVHVYPSLISYLLSLIFHRFLIDRRFSVTSRNRYNAGPGNTF
jgi:hypothetical protein